MAGITGLKQLK